MRSLGIGTAGVGTAGRIKALVVLPALLLAGLSGCKTQDDAVAAADQMTKTARTLSAYYKALDKVVEATERTREARFLLNGVPADNTIQEDTRKQLKLRADLAAEIEKMAAAMQQIVTSKAPKDAATEAAKFNAEVVTATGLTSNDGETKAVTESVKLLVQLVQENDEVKAAKQVATVSHALAVFFASEEAAYEALNDQYLVAAKEVATLMVNGEQADVSVVYRPALTPFGLEPAVTQATKTKMRPFLLTRIDSEYKEKVEAANKATAALGDALDEMDARVKLVANDKPMKIRLEPVTLDSVRGWAASAAKEAQQ